MTDKETPIVKKGLWHWLHQVFQNNKDLDSSGMLLFIGGGAIVHQVFCFIKPTYAGSAAGVELTKMYTYAIIMMVMYFFKKGSTDDGGQK